MSVTGPDECSRVSVSTEFSHFEETVGRSDGLDLFRSVANDNNIEQMIKYHNFIIYTHLAIYIGHHENK